MTDPNRNQPHDPPTPLNYARPEPSRRMVVQAILGCIAAGKDITGYSAISQAIQAMAAVREDVVYRPDLAARKLYAELYGLYRELSRGDAALAEAMRRLR